MNHFTVRLEEKDVEESIGATRQSLQRVLLEDRMIFIEDDEQRQTFIDLLFVVKEAEKTLKAKKEKLFRPWEEMKKNIMEMFFDEPFAEITRMKTAINKAVLSYDRGVKEARAKALKEAEATRVSLTEPPRVASRATVYGQGTGTTRKVSYTPVVEDLDSLPGKYLMADMSALKAEAKGFTSDDKPPPAIPGIRWELRETLVTNAHQRRE